MPRHFHAVRVRGFDRRAQFFRRDVLVGLERRHALRNPEFHRAARIFGIGELMHLEGEGSRAFQVRPGDVNLGAGHLPVIRVAFELEIRIRLDASRGSNRSHASRQIQPRKTCGMLGVKRRRPARRRVIHVVVHADQARNDRTPGKINDLRTFGNLCAGAVAKRSDLSLANHERLVGSRGRARAVDDAHMRQRNERRVFLYERAQLGSEFRRGLGTATRSEQGSQHQRTENREQPFSHESTPEAIVGLGQFMHPAALKQGCLT